MTGTRLNIHCEACRKSLRIRPEFFGKAVTCKGCGHAFVAPTGGPDGPAKPAGSPAAEPPPGGAAELATVSQKLKRKREQHSAAVKQLWVLNGRYQRLKGQFWDLRAHFERLDEQYRQREARLEAIEGARSDLASRLEAARGLAETRQRDLDALREEAARRCGELEAARGRLEGRERELTEARRLLADGGATLAAEEEWTRARLDALEAEVEATRDGLALRDAELTDLRRQLAEAHEQVRLRAREADQSRGELALRDEELAESRRQAARKDAELGEASSLLRSQVGDLAALRADRERLEVERATLMATLEASRQNLIAMGNPTPRPQDSGGAKLEALVRAIEGERRQWEEERTFWKELLQEERAEAARRDERVDEMDRQFEREREILRRAAERFDAEISPLRQERERITAYRDQLQATFRQAEEALQAKLAGLAQQHAEAARERDLAIHRGDEMAGQIRELRDRVERSRALAHAPRVMTAKDPSPPGGPWDRDGAGEARDLALSELGLEQTSLGRNLGDCTDRGQRPSPPVVGTSERW